MSYVLVVDDEPDGAEVVLKVLERSAIHARAAANGQEALRELMLETPDAVVLDVRMPEMDGISLLEILRSYLRWYHMPVILLTAHATKAQIDRAKELGVEHIYQKTNFSLNDLVSCVKELIPRPVGRGYEESGED
jgi:two-component system response regulator AtoC